MSGRGRQEDKKNDGPGFLSSLLLAGGAAAVGFMAHKLMTEFETEQSHESARPQERANSSTAWGTETNRTDQRKANRAKVADEDLPMEVRCIVCMANPREIILVPCGHVCLCEDCADKIKTTCPVCNGKIEAKRAAYLP